MAAARRPSLLVDVTEVPAQLLPVGDRPLDASGCASEMRTLRSRAPLDAPALGLETPAQIDLLVKQEETGAKPPIWSNASRRRSNAAPIANSRPSVPCFGDFLGQRLGDEVIGGAPLHHLLG